MDSLLERIEENRLDALYLFINEILRDPRTFGVFLQNLMSVLPHNWSIQRVEVGHEFLSMVTSADMQDDLFDLICGLESLRTLIISDGYVPRKDNGFVQTEALLSSLPKARNLINLDLQRLELKNMREVRMLRDVFESMSESLEEIRITGLVVSAQHHKQQHAQRSCRQQLPLQQWDEPSQRQEEQQLEAPQGGGGNRGSLDAAEDVSFDGEDSSCASTLPGGAEAGVLDGVIQQCVDMANLRSLAISQKEKQRVEEIPNDAASSSSAITGHEIRSLLSQDCLLNLCQNSTTLQDLALRNMNLDNPTCQTLAKALTTNSFLTSLDLRQNPRISTNGYSAILQALERNYDLWCTVMVDNDSFQTKFNALIELNQANRGDLVRNPTSDKLATFLGELNSHHRMPTAAPTQAPPLPNVADPTSLWYFLTIHDTILFPLVDYLQWKSRKERRRRRRPPEIDESEKSECTKRPRLA